MLSVIERFFMDGYVRGWSVFVTFIRTDELSRWLRESTCNAGNVVLIHGSGKSPGEGTGYPLRCSCLGQPMDGGAWWAAVHGVEKESDTTYQLNPGSFRAV